MKLSVIIPVYNEQNTLADLLRRVKAVRLAKEIIVVDDGSTDRTRQILRRFAKDGIKIVTFPKNRGKGAAVRKGIEVARGDYIVIQDADLEYHPEDWKKLLEPVKSRGVKAVYGSRFMGSYRIGLTNFLHFLANRLLTGLTNLLYASRLSDMETAYKLIESKLAQSLNLKSDRFEIEPEITAKILKKGIKIHEVPISYAGRQYHEGKKITWRDGLTSLWAIVYYRFFN